MIRPTCLLLLLACAALARPVAADDAQQAATRDFNATAALQNAGFYERAAQRWQEFLGRYPDDARRDRAHYYLGIAQLKSDKLAEAQKTFETLLARYPNFKERDKAQFNLGFARYLQAERSQKPDDFRAAAEALALVAKQHPNSSIRDRAAFYEAGALYHAGDTKNATEAYARFVNQFGQSSLLPDALYALGSLYQQQGDPAKAAETFEAFLKKPAHLQHAQASTVRLHLGLALFDLKKFDAARQHLAPLAAEKDNPHAVRALLELGRCHLEQSQWGEAEQKFRELLEKHPQSDLKLPAHYYRGLAFFQQNKFDEARQSLEASLAAEHPLAPHAALVLAKTLTRQQKPQEALARIEAAIAKASRDPILPSLELERARILHELPDRRKELPGLYKAFLEKHREHALAPLAQASYAIVALEQQDYATARQIAETFLATPALSDHPSRGSLLFVAGEAHYLAADAAQNGGDRQKAGQYFRQLVEKHPQLPSVPAAHVRIGQLLLHDAKYDEARQYVASRMATFTEPRTKAEAQLVIGRTHSAQSRHAEAQAAYQAALDAYGEAPGADEALLWLADSLYRQQKLPEADQHLERLLSRFATSRYRPQALVQRGTIATAQERYDDALARFREVLEKHADAPQQPAALYGLATVHYAKKDDGQAIAALDKLLGSAAKETPLGASAYLLRATARERQKQYESAARDYQAFLATRPTDDRLPQARLALARCQIALKQHKPAAEGLAALVSEHPQFAALDQALYELGHARQALDQTSEAADAFRQLTDRFPDSPLAAEAWFHQGRHYELAAAAIDDKPKQDEALAKAAEAYRRGAEKAPAGELREKLRFKQGETLYRRAQYAAAVTPLEELVREQPQGVLAGAARFLTGECYFHQNKFDQALPHLQQTVADQVKPYHALALFRCGACEAQRKAWSESAKHFAALVSAFPDFPQRSEARYGLGLALYEQNKHDEARATFEAVIAETDQEPAAKARFMLGEIAFGQKKFTDAIEHFLLCSEGYAYPHWQGMARLETARAFIELGDKPQAIKTLEQLLDKQPDHAKSAEARQLLAELKK